MCVTVKNVQTKRIAKSWPQVFLNTMNNSILKFIQELEDTAICYQLDGFIDSLADMKKEEQENEQYFNNLFKSIFYEQPILHA